MQSGDRGRWRRAEGLLPLLLVVLVAAGVGACSSRYKKLSRGGSMTDVLMYDVLNRDRSPEYYYSFVRSSHREKDFCYECGQGDPYLVDKNIDALERLGRAGYGRLEGLGEVVELLSEVVAEDRSALAQAQAATSMTKIALRLPRYEYRAEPDDGSKLLQYMQDVDRAYLGRAAAPGNAPTARRLPCPPSSQSLVVDRIRRIGNLEFSAADIGYYRQSIKFFYGRPYLVDEQTAAIRQAIDTALTKRIYALIRVSLESAVVSGRDAQVREDAVRGLKTLEEVSAAETVAEQLRFESSWLVRMEAAEYFGRVGTRTGVKTLIALLEDANASVRHKARASLQSLAGQDYGVRPSNWKWWARQKDPTIVFADDETDEGGDDADLGPGR